MKRFIIFIAVFSISAASTAQILKPVKWSYASKRVSDTEAVVLIKATMEKGWHIYSQTVPESGPQPTRFSFEPSKGYKLMGKTGEPQPITELEKPFAIELSYSVNSVASKQRVTLFEVSRRITGKKDS